MNIKKILVVFFAFACLLFLSCCDDSGESGSEVKLKDMPKMELARYENVRFESIPYDEKNSQSTQYGYDKGYSATVANLSIQNMRGTHFNTHITEGSNFDYYEFYKISGGNGWGVYPSGKLYSSNTAIKTDVSGDFGTLGAAIFTLRGVVIGGKISELLQGNTYIYPLRTIKLYIQGSTTDEKNDIISNAKKTFRQAVCDVQSVDNYNSANCVLIFKDYGLEKKIRINNTKEVLININYDNKKVLTKTALMAIGYRFGLNEPNSNIDTYNLMNPNYGYNHLVKEQWDIINRNVH